MPKLSSLLLAVSLVSLLMLGCGDADKPYGNVSGVVSAEGVNFSDVVLVFSSDSQMVHKTARINEKGEYRVNRLLPGQYGVCFTSAPHNLPTGQEPPHSQSPHQQPIPKALRSVETSGLELEVEVGANQFDITVP